MEGRWGAEVGVKPGSEDRPGIESTDRWRDPSKAAPLQDHLAWESRERTREPPRITDCQCCQTLGASS